MTQTDAKRDARALAAWHEETTFPAEITDTARMVVASGYYPTMRSVAQAAFKIAVGREMGLSLIESLNYVHVIPPRENAKDPAPKIHLGYQVLAALVQRSGKYRYEVEAKTDTECRVVFYRYDAATERRLGASVFTIEDAKRAGLITDYSAWKKYPATMLFARALSTGVKTYCPSVLSGNDVSEEPYIAGTARLIEPEPEDMPAEVHAPPEGFEPRWAEFWATARDLGYDKPGVHAFFGVAETDGALLAHAEGIAEAQGMTLPEVVAAMLVQLKAFKQETVEGEWAALAETDGAVKP